MLRTVKRFMYGGSSGICGKVSNEEFCSSMKTDYMYELSCGHTYVESFKGKEGKILDNDSLVLCEKCDKLPNQE
ncbi:MAG TPA: hypothetical protein VI815_02725 [Candidatus Nanoarchaeia archaeon]|nr:hypothetical protein [Candidatus Nanoarchaeia archaeon]